MKIVINSAFGGFGYQVDPRYEDMVRSHRDDRTNPELIHFVENNPLLCGDLEVVIIPDSVTDWYIDEYDGRETVIYVMDGKIYWGC